jgi:protease-4
MRPGFSPRRLIAGALVGCALWSSGESSAQPTFPGPTRLPAYGRALATNDDSTALVKNPANLAFLPGFDLRWVGAFLDEESSSPEQGHALAIGFPLPIMPLGTGLRTDFVSPPEGARTSALPASYQWLTWGLGLRGGDAFGIGVSLERTYSGERVLHGLSSWSAGLTLRPWPVLALGGAARHINAPTNATGGVVFRQYDFGLALRPWSHRGFELGAEALWVDDQQEEGTWIPRGTLGVDLPRIGRLRADFELRDVGHRENRSWVASANLALYLNSPMNSSEAAIGTRFGTGLGDRSEHKAIENLQAEVAVKGWREPGASELPRQWVRIRIESTPDPREHVALLRKLWRLAERESAVDAVVLELRAAPSGHHAAAQELRDAVHYLRLRNKRVLCHLEDAGGSSLYVGSAADRILVNPAGGLRFAGLRTRYLYYASLLAKLGVRADFVRIGDHKSAPEAFTRDQSSELARGDKIDLLQQYEAQFVAGVAAGRRLSVSQVRERIARGPFLASEALAVGFVDGFAFDDQIDAQVSQLVGRQLTRVEDEHAPVAPEQLGEVPKIALVYAQGDLVDGRSRDIPFVGVELLGSYTLAETLKQVRENANIKAVVLRIESPGGSGMAADVIWRQVQLTAQIKPVIVSMGNVAASGGYYIAAPATRIFANPATVTGSIGVYYGKADVAELLGKIGVSVEVYKTAPRADIESIFRPYTADEREVLRQKVRQWYDAFVSRVSAGRRLTVSQVDAVGQGRVWTGTQAAQRGLVDEVGGLRQALEHARRLGGLPRHAPMVELPPPKTSLLGRLLGVPGVGESGHSVLPLPIEQVVRALGPFLVFAGDQPVARLEIAEMGP